MRVLERTHLVGAAKTLLEILDVGKDLVTGILGGGLLGSGKALELLLNLVGLGHLVEEAGEESTLLGGDLSSGGVVGNSTVTDGPDVLGALDDKVLVDVQTTTGIGLSGNLGHQILDNGTDSVTGGPDEQTVRNLLHNLLAVGTNELGLDVFLGNVLDHGLGTDVNGLLLEGLLGVVNQLLGEHGKNLSWIVSKSAHDQSGITMTYTGKGLNESDTELIGNFGHPGLEVVLEEVLELTSELDTGRATTNDDHVEKTLALLRALVLESGGFTAVHNTLADTLSISNLLQEARVLADTRDT